MDETVHGTSVLKKDPQILSARVELASEYIQEKSFRLVLLDATVGHFIPLR